MKFKSTFLNNIFISRFSDAKKKLISSLCSSFPFVLNLVLTNAYFLVILTWAIPKNINLCLVLHFTWGQIKAELLELFILLKLQKFLHVKSKEHRVQLKSQCYTLSETQVHKKNERL